MSETSVGTNGGEAGTSGVQRRLALVMAGLFLLVLILITIGNAESMISDFEAAGVRETKAHIWSWQITSVLAWLTVTPLIWWGVARFRPPRFRWPTAAIALLAGLPLTSGWHIGLMIALRKLVDAAEGALYRFEGGIRSPYLYEFRKDVPTYIQFVALALLCQWLLARVGGEARPAAAESDRFLLVGDGAVTHRVPVAEIVQLCAAGNYVEIDIGTRTLLHRATLGAMEEELGDAFVRIHRSRLVSRAAIRRIATNQAGDFEVVLADGRALKGSRRYRQAVEQRL